LIFIIGLAVLAGSWFQTKLGISVFNETAPAAKLLSWQHPEECHFVSFDAHLWCQVPRILL